MNACCLGFDVLDSLVDVARAAVWDAKVDANAQVGLSESYFDDRSAFSQAIWTQACVAVHFDAGDELDVSGVLDRQPGNWMCSQPILIAYRKVRTRLVDSDGVEIYRQHFVPELTTGIGKRGQRRSDKTGALIIVVAIGEREWQVVCKDEVVDRVSKFWWEFVKETNR